VAGGFLDEPHTRRQAQLGVDVGEVGLHCAVHDDPQRLDITREDPPAMLTFGGGVHYCLGAHLARLELTEGLRVITRHMPNPRRTGPAPRKAISGITGPTALRIKFDTGH
jgi:cytochrome P450